MQIEQGVRQDIFDYLTVEKIDWNGRLDETQFLSRIWNLEELPSTDSRFRTASGDIWQHRVNNHDWDDDWIYTDTRFNLLHCDDEIFLRFLCEMIHPIVRADPTEVDRIRQIFNDVLVRSDFQVVEKTTMGGRPVFSARHLDQSVTLPGDAIVEHLAGDSHAYVSRQITRMEIAVSNDPDLAIGTAKELVETCCKTILMENGVAKPESDDLTKLMRQTIKVLKLSPDDIPDSAKASETIRRLLMNLAAVAQGLAELRNNYGTGHGQSATRRGLQTRHARLAANAASTLATFLVETASERQLR